VFSFKVPHMNRARAVPAIALALGLAVIVAIVLLAHRADQARDSQLALAGVKIELNSLQIAPFRADARTGGSPRLARRLIVTGKSRIAGTMTHLQRQSPPRELAAVDGLLRTDYAILDRIYAIGVSGKGYGQEADRLSGVSGKASDQATTLLDAAAREYERRADRARRQDTAGSVVAILLLLVAFSLFYRRSIRARAVAEQLAVEKQQLLETSRTEALTDALTGLGNRRALVRDLAEHVREATERDALILALFDLDGFKQYNDTFGHPAGDALLTRLSERLRAVTEGAATVYRMGGDEFCLLGRVGSERGGDIVSLAAQALSDVGESFRITCSYGVARVPTEATSPEDALRLADQRMYASKGGRTSASRQSTDVLLQVLSERTPDLDEHLSGVARLAACTAERLGLPETEVARIELGAELHDVGKTAIPVSILAKPGPLDADEWAFMRRHTLIGERIVRAAPSLAHVAQLVRSSHERHDGQGYPDGLAGDEISLGASVIAVCDAFDAMVSERPYRKAMSVEQALGELRRFAGTQFRPEVVEAFCGAVRDQEPARVIYDADWRAALTPDGPPSR
jgi:diguanylate cyclase (GGDEF)-like protein